ncbi:MAG: family 10 glycosylhydrolase [Prevotellaceae bacterium]|nr:family 10 glycosylhydrolase [Prevotellaceae bacterium]
MNIIRKIIYISLIALLYFSPSCEAQNIFQTDNPKYEVRAVWLTTIGGLDWPHNYAQNSFSIEKQKKELIDILDKLKEENINTVLFQTRIRGTVIYPSSIEPWDGCCSGVPGKSPGYDPLAFAIEECHKRGMEIQAWVVTIPVGKWNGYGCKTLRKKYPKLIVKSNNEGFINPSSPQAASYIADICKEITSRYDVDGIHLDYIRYPETWKLNISNDKARDNITNIVRSIYSSIKTIKPWVKLSCSPIGKYNDLNRFSSHGWNAYTKGCQDAQGWLRLGIMDQLYPMMYFRNDQFFPFAFDWKENCCERTIVPGLGIYFLSPNEGNWQAEDIQRQMFVLRDNNMGYAFFRNKFFCDNVKGVYDFTKYHINKYPALVPPMTWSSKRKPEAPTELKVIRNKDSQTIVWNNVSDNISNGGILYNVYASNVYPVNTDDARNLIAQRIKNNYITITDNKPMFYAVRSIDRYGIESCSVQEVYKQEETVKDKFIENDGYKMLLPDKGKTLDADYIIIESLTGTIIKTMPYKGKYADISSLKDGCYVVLSLNKKSVTHRLGHLMIKRKKPNN